MIILGIQAGWESMPNVEDVSCSVAIDGLGTTYLVELSTFPALPYQNNIFEHGGNPGIASFACDISHVSDLCVPSIKIRVLSRL